MREFTLPDGKLFGYAGKILRINLTDSTTEEIPVTKYIPEYIGGRAVATKIFWDEVGAGVHAFDPENKLIYMTGPMNATGVPNSGRACMVGISPNALPEQFNHSSAGGFFGGMLKFAGYDGFIVEGKAPFHTYVLILDDKIEFLPADDFIWGDFTFDTQKKIMEKHGHDTHSFVIGPAGENLHRNATITTNGDSAFAKSGFGAVWGSKNLKAIAVRGTGRLIPADVKRILELRKSAACPDQTQNPKKAWKFDEASLLSVGAGGDENNDEGKDTIRNARMCCAYGCLNSMLSGKCLNTFYNVPNPMGNPGTLSLVQKCMDACAASYQSDIGYRFWNGLYSKRNAVKGTYKYNQLVINDPEDPQVKIYSYEHKGSRMDLWGPNGDRQMLNSYLCNAYGLDKWDCTLWYFSWFVMADKEGLLEDFPYDIGMKVDMDNFEFIKHIYHIMTYREGELGNLLAEGMARFIRAIGKDKYGDAIYHGRISPEGERLDLPCSMEAGWGHMSHYQGRGFQGDSKFVWLVYTLSCMIDARDTVQSQHFHMPVDSYLEFKDDPCHSRVFVREVIHNCAVGMLKDTLGCCEWKSPDPGDYTQEADLFQAATGIHATEDELFEHSLRVKMLERAIYMRNHGRTRDMEVEEMYPFITYPDYDGLSCTWDEFNDLVDIFYQGFGWDIATGWPTRSTWEKYGLKSVADELEVIGMIPDENTAYRRKDNPFKDWEARQKQRGTASENL